jgi:hypothetical protein
VQSVRLLDGLHIRPTHLFLDASEGRAPAGPALPEKNQEILPGSLPAGKP